MNSHADDETAAHVTSHEASHGGWALLGQHLTLSVKITSGLGGAREKASKAGFGSNDIEDFESRSSHS
jgi:hypothetical protein